MIAGSSIGCVFRCVLFRAGCVRRRGLTLPRNTTRPPNHKGMGDLSLVGVIDAERKIRDIVNEVFYDKNEWKKDCCNNDMSLEVILQLKIIIPTNFYKDMRIITTNTHTYMKKQKKELKLLN